MKTILALSTLLFLLISQTSQAQTTSVSGSISLPAGIVAGPSGVEIELRGLFFEINNPLSQQTVTIAPGQSSTSYALEFEITETDQSIVFNCNPDCFDLGVTSQGAWSETDGVVSTFLGTDYATGTINQVDITLENATIFSGRVLFPNDFVATNNDFIIVTVNSATQFSLSRFSDSTITQAGDTSFEFRITAPSDEAGIGWTLLAACPFDCDTQLIFSQDSHATTINGDPTSLDQNSAFVFPAEGNFQNLVVTLQGPVLEPDAPQEDVILAPVVDLLLNQED